MSITRTDFVRVIEGKSLHEAIEYIETLQNTVNRVPVTVFRSVLPEHMIDSLDITTHLIENRSIKIIKEQVHVVQPNVHEICPVNATNKNRKELIKICREDEEFLKRYPNESDNEYGLRMFQKYFDQTKNGDFYALYGRDSTIAPNGMTLLNFKKSTLVDNRKIQVTGVNSSMWYISGPGSATVFHNEDADQPSINLCLKGKPKTYAFIPFEFAKRLAEKVNGNMKCQLFHKPGFVINPTIFKDWEIPVQFYAQKEGDLIFIGERVLHAVINNGVAIAEAINYGTKASLIGPALSLCGCKDRGRLSIEEILQKPIPTKKVPKSKKRMYTCKVPNCFSGKVIYNKKEFIHHNVDMHSCKPFQCNDCNKHFMRKENVRLHIQKMHVQSNSATRIKKVPKVEKCEFCELFISKQNKDRHIREQHVDDACINCELCGSRILQRNLLRHKKVCVGNLECHCGRKFNSQRYLTQHQKSHK